MSDHPATSGTGGNQAMNRLPLPDESAHQDGLLMVEVTRVNTMLGRYVLRFLDSDADRTAEMPVADERALAERVAAVAGELHARADRREHQGDPLPLIGLDGMMAGAGCGPPQDARVETA